MTIFKYFRRDILAGTITGTMAVPLSIGICLMSDYPIMTGLYTVIFACLVSFTMSLIRPGNYVGTPGIAAGLAPALAMGITTFGFENMPFLILMTSLFQMVVWYFKWERFILQLVPHYLVEGLLAGVGLKIAYKFIPFLYEYLDPVTHQAITTLPIISTLSILSFGGFVYLYNRYKASMPALPYIVVIGVGIALSFFMPFPMVALDKVPFRLALPLPHIGGFNGLPTIILVVQMLGFSIMLGIIDVIEQVMSNVAIEKLDPLGRKCDSNNSLLTIWIANMGATFFGGMTNLDGLAKSTTNAVAGAMTKLSNVVTAMVLLGIVLFPSSLNHFPKYALGIIMIYSGWKMISNLNHVRKEGTYALALSIICGLLVFKLGIFEGLLIVLAFHGALQWIFKYRLEKKTSSDLSVFRKDYQSHAKGILPGSDTLSLDTPDLARWVAAINAHHLDDVLACYDQDCVFTPAFSTKVCYGIDSIQAYYEKLLSKEQLFIRIFDVSTVNLKKSDVFCGQFGIGWHEDCREYTHVMRFSMTVSNHKIIMQHTSLLPTGSISISDWESNKPETVDFIF